MKPIDSLEERHKVLLDLLSQFDSLCKELDVTYMLAYGTLLGAIRHKGFIPWDDDVDVMMTRREYEKFISRYHHNEDARYKLISIEIDSNYFSPLAKFYDDKTVLIQNYGQRENQNYGIYLDVFIIDAIPDDINEANNFIKEAENIRFLWATSVKEYSAGYKNFFTFLARIPLIFFCRLLGRDFFIKCYNKKAQQYRDKDTNHCGVVVFGEGLKKEFFKKRIYEELCSVEFEGLSFPAPKEYDIYLSQMYGDYMKLPPLKNRKIHPNKAYWKN